MGNSTTVQIELLRTAAIQARLAPSVHNTQPWRFVLTENALEIHADPKRQLTVLDPTRRQLVISCGCALFNARVALAARGYQAVVERLPDRTRPHLLARITVASELGDPLPIGALDPCIISRQTDRRRFTDDTVSPRLVAQLTEAVQQEQALFVAVQRWTIALRWLG